MGSDGINYASSLLQTTTFTYASSDNPEQKNISYFKHATPLYFGLLFNMANDRTLYFKYPLGRVVF